MQASVGNNRVWEAVMPNQYIDDNLYKAQSIDGHLDWFIINHLRELVDDNKDWFIAIALLIYWNW